MFSVFFKYAYVILLRITMLDIYHLKVMCYLFRKVEKKIDDTFIGYHADTCAAIIHDICEKRKSTTQTMHNERIQVPYLTI